jgi:enamine deaminase RidA (YjgF/YER057c/UK114 family)
VTVNVGVIGGGTRPNVVPEHCSLEVDVRAVSRDALETAEAEMRRLAEATEIEDTTVEFEVMARWWPMEKLERSGRLVEHARAVAHGIGFEVRDAATGGASDANTTAGMGVPSLDGLGPIGGNDHSPAEYLDVESIVPRTTLLAGLLLAIAASGGARLAPPPRMTRRPIHRRSMEAAAGYSRAAVVGDTCWVAGTTDAGPDGLSLHPGDVAAQARAVFAIIEAALRDGGFVLADIVRIRIYVTDIGWSSQVTAVMGAILGSIRPAATMVQVGALMDPSLLVEIEADARRGSP